MALSPTAANAANTSVTTPSVWVSMHDGSPGSTGANELTGSPYARKQTTWGTVQNGIRTGTQVAIGVPAGSNCTHWGVWTTATGGTFYAGFQLELPEEFASAGEYLLLPTVAAE